MIIELKYASVPQWEWIAVHYWFVTNDSGKRERWEVWQEPDVGHFSIGHLHRDFMRPDSCVGGGPTRHAHQWEGDPAKRLLAALHESWNEYPYRKRYRALPGPNSNTYVAWILKRADVPYRLSWKAIGKNFK